MYYIDRFLWLDWGGYYFFVPQVVVWLTDWLTTTLCMLHRPCCMVERDMHRFSFSEREEKKFEKLEQFEGQELSWFGWAWWYGISLLLWIQYVMLSKGARLLLYLLRTTYRTCLNMFKKWTSWKVLPGCAVIYVGHLSFPAYCHFLWEREIRSHARSAKLIVNLTNYIMHVILSEDIG